MERGDYNGEILLSMRETTQKDKKMGTESLSLLPENIFRDSGLKESKTELEFFTKKMGR